MAESKVDMESNVCEEVSNNYTKDRESEEEKPAGPGEEYWQTFRETIRERNRYMFNNTLMSDVNFLVGSLGTSEQEEGRADDGIIASCIPAHKYVLAISSPVFYAMFYGSLPEVDNTVVIPDSTYECFLEFLRFLYCDELDLTIDCVLGVRYLAKKYIVPSLEKRCVVFVEDVVDAGNVFRLLSYARSYKDELVERVCWEYLDSETLDALKSASFTQVDRQVIQELLTRDTLHAKEIELFLALQKWVIAQNPDHNGDDKLSKDEEEEQEKEEESVSKLVNLVRYPLMSQREFAEHVVKSKLLQHEDVISMFLKFNDTLEDDTILPFSQVPRRGYYRCSLYEDVYCHNWDMWDHDASKMPSVLSFSSNSNILLCGVGLYGNDNKDASYSFRVNVTDEDSQILLSSEGSFTCHAQCFTYDVIFNKPVKVHKNIWYSIRATVDGPRAVYGGQSVATMYEGSEIGEITCGPLKFLFKVLNDSSEVQLQNIYSHFAGLLYFLH